MQPKTVGTRNLQLSRPGPGTRAQELATAGAAGHEVVFEGLRHDTGDKADHLRTAILPACERPGPGREFPGRLKEFVTVAESSGA